MAINTPHKNRPRPVFLRLTFKERWAISPVKISTKIKAGGQISRRKKTGQEAGFQSAEAEITSLEQQQRRSKQRQQPTRQPKQRSKQQQQQRQQLELLGLRLRQLLELLEQLLQERCQLLELG